jgi:2-methylisocitrate lyase-like PEP mutase family enzyme
MAQRIPTSPGIPQAVKALAAMAGEVTQPGTGERAVAAAALRSLHVRGKPLILPNVWDAASARLVAQAGFPVVATSSGAVAESIGYSDHQGGPVDEIFAAVKRIARVVSVPVTMDAEGGYGLPTRELADRLTEAGVAGCNIEDTDHAGSGLVDVDAQADKIAALRAAVPELVINARIDLFLTVRDQEPVRGQEPVLDEAIERARAYLAAGADCVFPIFVRSADVLKDFVDAVSPAAVNTLYVPGGPDLAELKELGVARISLGTGLWWNTQAVLTGKLARLAEGILPY